MAKQSVLEQIYTYHNGLLRAKVHRMIDDNETLSDMRDFIITFTDGEIQPSIGTINNYKAKLATARKENKDLGELLDKRKKNGENILDIKSKEHNSLMEKDNQVEENAVYEPREDRLISTTQVLEKMIAIGNATLGDIEHIDPNTLIRVIKTYSDITGAANGGLMLSGLQQIALQQKAYESALGEVIAKYIPEDQQDKAWADLELAEQQFYDDLDITKEGREVKQTMDKLGITL